MAVPNHKFESKRLRKVPMSQKTILDRLSGSAYALAGDTLAFYQACERSSGIVRTHCWGLPVYVVTEPALIEEIFIRQKHCFVKSAGLRANRRAFGNGLLTSGGAQWRRNRQIIQPAFRVSKLGLYWPWVDAAMDRVLGSWGHTGVRDVHKEMADLCFEALAVPLFGEDLADVRMFIVEAVAALHEFHQSCSRGVAVGGLAVAAMRAVSTWLGHPEFFFDPSLLPTKSALRLRLAIAELDRFVYDFIDRRAKMPVRDDLVSLLLAARDASGAALSRREIRDEIVSMFFAGHETGAASISWTLYLLAKHRDIATRLAAEPPGSTLGHLILHESLRLYPPAYRVSRTAIQPCQIGAMKITSGAEIVIPQWAVHRSPRNFCHPEEFRPDRWTPEFTRKLPKFAYFPFGGGQRTCIGNNFGFHESVRVVTEINRRFQLRLHEASEPSPQLGITLLPKEGSLKMDFRRRRSSAALPATDRKQALALYAAS